MQMTVSTPLEHEENGGIMKSFKTLVPQIIFDITGQSVSFTYNKISGNIECQPANSIKLEFVIFTWRTKDEAMKKKPNHNYQNLPNNLLIVSKESLPFIPTTKPTSSIWTSQKPFDVSMTMISMLIIVLKHNCYSIRIFRRRILAKLSVTMGHNVHLGGELTPGLHPLIFSKWHLYTSTIIIFNILEYGAKNHAGWGLSRNLVSLHWSSSRPLPTHNQNWAFICDSNLTRSSINVLEDDI